MKVVLTIAGSDSGAAAGLQADLKTFQANGVYGVTVVTAITAQNLNGIRSIFYLPPAEVAGQIETVSEGFEIAAIKIGMLGDAGIIETVADKLRGFQVPIVVDPVMVATSGASLLQPDAFAVLNEKLLPIAALITPNIPEAERLVGFSINSQNDLKQAGRSLIKRFPNSAILIKGGHFQPVEIDNAPFCVDTLLTQADVASFYSPYIQNLQTRGTGCTLASAIAAGLAKGFCLKVSVEKGVAYLQKVIQNRIVGLGNDRQPLGH